MGSHFLFKAFLVFLSGTFLIGCGSEPIFIADSVRIRIFFMERMAEIEARLNENYRTKINSQERFDYLALIQMESKEAHKLKIVSHIDPEVLKQKWPFEKISRLPGGHRFPSPLKKVPLNQWRGDQFSFLTGNTDVLHLGATVQNDDFSLLPEGFFAVQEVFAKDQTLRASLALFGPTENSKGGLYLMSYLGINPFHEGLEQDVFKLELTATEGAKIISRGRMSIGAWFGPLGLNFF